MYKHKPGSPTVAVWGQRYFRAYLDAHHMPYASATAKGHAKLLDKSGMPVPGAKLGTHVGMDAQNKAVKNYLKHHGGMLEIEVHDIPGISLVPGNTRNIERVLIFNCGVTGMGPRVPCWQHIKIDTTQPRHTWTRNFQMGGNPPGLRTTGLTRQQNYAEFPNTTPAEGAMAE